MNESTISRRGIVAGAVAALGGAAIAPVAHAFSRGAQARFRAASEILAPFGVTVRGESANARVAHDVLMLEVEPRRNTQYDHVLGPQNDFGEIIPCIKTTVFEGVEELGLFDADAPRANPPSGPCGKAE
jgi:hypothetical protein